jgi:hypothetical protein
MELTQIHWSTGWVRISISASCTRKSSQMSFVFYFAFGRSLSYRFTSGRFLTPDVEQLLGVPPAECHPPRFAPVAP